MTSEPSDVVEASAAVSALPATAEVTLSTGRRIDVCRLDWLKFELVWAELSSLLAALLSGAEEPTAATYQAELAQAPALTLKLTSLSTGLAESELARLCFDDVLVLAAAALELNFVQGAGIRRFFSAVSALAADPGAKSR